MVIPPKKEPPMPPLYAALGAAAAYYGYPLVYSLPQDEYLLLGLLFLFVLTLSFLRVLRRLPGEEVPVYITQAGILVIAAAVGFSLGFAARRSISIPVEMGLPRERIRAVAGILREDPRTLQSGSGMGILELRETSGQGKLRSSARGSIVVFFPPETIPRLKEFGRGCELYTEGSLVSGSRGLLFRASSAHILKPAPALEQFRTAFRMAILERLQGKRNGKIPLWGPLASALLLGVRDDLDTDMSEGFRNSGCSHVLALSGMHLAILSGLLAFLLRPLLGIRVASLAGAAFIVFYVFLAGSQPSLVRAAVMYLIGTFALLGFLKTWPLSLLSMAFVLQLLFQSESGISYSFILSYLALGGILTFGKILGELFRGRLPEILVQGVSASLGAFIATAPAVVLFFGSLRPVGIIAGLVIAPVSSVFMILALVSLAVSFLPFPLWDLFDFVLTWIYRLMEFLVSLAGQVPGFFFSNPVPVLIISILTGLLLLFFRNLDWAHRKNLAPFA
jgi:competence protein ComEC